MERVEEGSQNLETSPNTEKQTRCSKLKEIFEEKCQRHISRDAFTHWIALILVGFSLWGILYSIAGAEVQPGSQLFGLAVLIVLAYIAGEFIRLIRLPPLLGMLLMGILLRNVGVIHLNDFYMELMSTMRQVALCIILTRAGLVLDPSSMKDLKFFILRLAAVPALVEILVVTGATHYFMGLPLIWGALAGSVVSALSPAIVVPCLFDLQRRGYGIEKNICTLLVAAASLDNVLAITVFGVIKNFIFNQSENWTMKIISGPLGIAMGVVFGILWGFILHYIPNPKNENVVLLRVLMMAAGGLLIMFGSVAIGYQGAGPLGCIAAAFVACIGWRKQGWTDKQNPVSQSFTTIWTVFQPIVFGMIGFEVNIAVLEGSTVAMAAVAVIASLVARTTVSILISFGGGFNWKEKLFFSWAWFPKAAVQAALGPVALDMAKLKDEPNLVEYGTKILVIAVLAILIAAPIGAALLAFSGPKLLKKSKKEEERIKKDSMATYSSKNDSVKSDEI